LQKTGNQAVDDKFTVLCYSHHDASRTLPGTALNNDPRFPFFRIGNEIEKVSTGEGRRIDTYLQLKTSSQQFLKGRTVIDSIVLGPQKTDISFGRIPGKATEWGFLSEPTPGNPNTSPQISMKPEPPDFSLDAGFYDQSQSLEYVHHH